ncbi:MAG TPA: hypothetical protein VGN64_12435 [Dyadobacter sp.]|jgi:hypothetical protein|nr:hypothetical protein [Dyadobacter sp.]
MSAKNENVAGGSPSPSGAEDEDRHEDDSKKPAKKVEKDAENKSEKTNMTDQKGYNEMPPDIPVESAKKKA